MTCCVMERTQAREREGSAAATIGELAVNVVAKTQKFSKGMKSAGKTVKGFGKTLTGTLKSIGGFAAGITGIGGLLTAGGLVAKFNSTAASLDRLGKSAASLGLGTQVLGAFQEEAALAGIEAEQVTKGLNRMTRAIDDAASGRSGAVAEKLEAIGLNAEKLNELDPAKQFEALAIATKDLSDAQKNITFQNLFGRQGAELVRLSKAAEDVDALTENYKDLIPDEAEVARVEAMNDSFERVGKAFQGVANKIVVEMAPAVQETMEGFVLAIEAMQRDDFMEDTPLGRLFSAGKSFTDAFNPLKAVGIEPTEILGGGGRGQTSSGLSRMIEESIRASDDPIAPKQLKEQQETNVILRDLMEQPALVMESPL